MEERAAKLECKDDNDKCQEWATSGQCQSNRVYMVSSLQAILRACSQEGPGHPSEVTTILACRRWAM